MSQRPAPQIAIIGATGVVGGEMLVELNEAKESVPGGTFHHYPP